MINLKMEKVKTFFGIFKDSLLPHYPYYHKILRMKFGTSLRYFFTLSLVVYALFLLIYALKFESVRSVKTTVNNFSESLQTYPDNLIIHIRDGQLSTNLNRPYFLWMNNEGSKLLLIVVDQNATVKDMDNYSSIALLTGHEFVIRNFSDFSKYRVYPLTNINTTITKATIMEAKSIVGSFTNICFIIIPLFFLLVLPIFIIGINVIYALLATLIVYLLAKLMMHRVGLHKTLQLSFHALTLPLVINYTLGLLNVHNNFLPLTFLMLYCVFVAVAVYESHLPDPALHHHKS